MLIVFPIRGGEAEAMSLPLRMDGRTGVLMSEPSSAAPGAWALQYGTAREDGTLLKDKLHLSPCPV